MGEDSIQLGVLAGNQLCRYFFHASRLAGSSSTHTDVGKNKKGGKGNERERERREKGYGYTMIGCCSLINFARSRVFINNGLSALYNQSKQTNEELLYAVKSYEPKYFTFRKKSVSKNRYFIPIYYSGGLKYAKERRKRKEEGKEKYEEELNDKTSKNNM